MVNTSKYRHNQYKQKLFWVLNNFQQCKGVLRSKCLITAAYSNNSEWTRPRYNNENEMDNHDIESKKKHEKLL